MSLTLKPMRYAHPEGHTDVCYFSGEKGGLVTCGSDGDVRYWLSLHDDDPSCQCIGEQATSCLSKNGKIYAGNDNNTLQTLTCPDLGKAGIVTRFSATVSALATSQKSKFIVSGSCDMRIHVTNIDTKDNIELNGHEAPILGLSLDPREKYVASSSSDGTIRVWNINERKEIHSWNVVPKSNSFFTAKSLSTPSFDPKDGKFLAYPHAKEIVVVERDSWNEMFRLKCSRLNGNINICKVSECGNRLAVASTNGEIIVWNLQNEDLVGYIEHPQNLKITSLAWHPKNSVEIVFCDSAGHLGCVDISSTDVHLNDFVSESRINDDTLDNNNDSSGGGDENDDCDNLEGNENVISLNKIKLSVNPEDDRLSHSDIGSDYRHESARHVMPEPYIQEPFQPGSTPVHLLSRFMLWNDIGIIRCYLNEGANESTIEVEFHDATIHHSMHMKNYLRHTVAALSSEALALGCRSYGDHPSKLVVIVLHGWGSGNREWTIDLNIDEEVCSVAAGDTFVALATSKRYLRIFMIGGVQREVVAIPGSVVAMNAHGSHLLVAYHSGVGIDKDQIMSILWIQIQGSNLKNQTLTLPLSPSTDLMWLGFSDLSSPIIMDTDGIVKIYNRNMRLWQIAVDMDKQRKGKLDHYFIVSVSETDKCIRCILCKGSHYPSTSPRPTTIEVPFSIPLCEIDTEKTRKEAPLWKIGSNPTNENTALFTLIGFFINGNADYRVVDICEHIAPQNIIELAIKYASQCGKMALSNKLQKIAEEKHRLKNDEIIEEDLFADIEESENVEENQIEKIPLTPIINQSHEIDIKPLSMSVVKKKNKFLKTSSPVTANKLDGLNSLPDKPEKSTTHSTPIQLKPKNKSNIGAMKETFVSWLGKNRAEIEEEFPDSDTTEITKLARQRFSKLTSGDLQNTGNSESKKRKLSSLRENDDIKTKKISNKLTDFLYDK